MASDRAGDDTRFHPFFEIWADWIGGRLGISVFGKLIAATIPGLAFFALHYGATRDLEPGASVAQFQAWSWLIGVMIVVCGLLLFYATHIFRGLLLQIGAWQEPDKKQRYLDRLNRTLGDRSFVRAGVLFGGLNALMGFWFGVPYADIVAQVSIFTGYFLVGFVCGMAVMGIYGVLVTVSVIARNGLPVIDFTAPGRCGGTQFLGDAFVKFSAVTLIMGVLISVYILFAGWTNLDSQPVRVAMGLWIVWPYLLAAAVLCGPASDVNRVLREYKLEKEKIFHDHLERLGARLEGPGLSKDERQLIEADIGRFTGHRNLLYTMRTWPFRGWDGLTYGVVLAGNLVASYQGALKFLNILKSANPL